MWHRPKACADEGFDDGVGGFSGGKAMGEGGHEAGAGEGPIAECGEAVEDVVEVVAGGEVAGLGAHIPPIGKPDAPWGGG